MPAVACTTGLHNDLWTQHKYGTYTILVLGKSETQ